MECYLETLVNGIYEIVKIDYTIIENVPQTPNEVNNNENNAKARATIINCISNTIFDKVTRLKIASYVWEKLSYAYERDPETKKAKLMNLKHKFERLRMSDHENIEEYMHKVNEIVNSIKGVDEKMEESDVVENCF